MSTLIPNPYSVQPVDSPKEFFGRRDITARIFSALNTEHPTSVSVTGERRIGKTSLLRYISNKTIYSQYLSDPEQYLFVYADANSTRSSSPNNVLSLLMRNIERQSGWRLLDDVSEMSIEQFSSAIEQLLTESSWRKLILVIDEFDILPADQGPNSILFVWLRALTHEYPLALVISSFRSLSDLSEGSTYGSPLWNIFLALRLGLFTREEAIELVRTPSAAIGLPLAAHENFVFELAGNHPYLLKLTCYTLIQHLNAASQLTHEDYPELQNQIAWNLRPMFATILNTLTPGEQSLLFRLARGADPRRRSLQWYPISGLVERGYLVAKGDKFDFFSSLFEDYVRSVDERLAFDSIEDAIEAQLFREGTVSPVTLPGIPEWRAIPAIESYWDNNNVDLDLTIDEDSKTISIKKIHSVRTLVEAWDEVTASVEVPIAEFGSHVEGLLRALCHPLWLQLVDEGKTLYKNLCVHQIDTRDVFDGTKLPYPLTVISLKRDLLSDGDIDDIRYLLNLHLEATSRVAVLLLFSGGETLDSARKILRSKLRRVHAYDIVAVGNMDLCRIVAAKKPQRALRKLVLAHVDLTRVSPFVTNGAVPDRMFFGREPELLEIINHADSTNYVLVGGRMIGKSSILKRLQRVRLPSAGFRAVYHDCSFTPSEGELIQAVATDRDWFPQPEGSRFKRLADVLQTLSGNKPLIVLFDEVDKLLPMDRAAGYPILNTLRGLSNAGRCHFVLSGERALYVETMNPNSPLYNFGNEMLIGRLTFLAVQELITMPMKQLEIELAEEANIVKRIWEFSSGHPNVIQRLCQRLITRINESQHRTLALKDVDDVVSDPEFLRKDFLNVFWERATVLERIATLLMSLDSTLRTLPAVSKSLTDHGISASLNSIDGALNRLVDLRAILGRSESGYEFAVSAFPEVVTRTVQAPDWIALYAESFRNYGDIEYQAEHGGS